MGIMNDTRFEKMDFQRIIEEQVRKNIVNNGNQQTVKTVTHSLGDVMRKFLFIFIIQQQLLLIKHF